MMSIESLIGEKECKWKRAMFVEEGKQDMFQVTGDFPGDLV